ncbi:MAG: hypothetical protein AAB924_01345 [Patescibacteria group bacterium]
MLSLFPDLFNFSILAPFILRIALGVPLINHGLNKVIIKGKFSQRILGGIVFLSGILLVIGLFTQVSAIVVSLIIIVNSIVGQQDKKPLSDRLIRLAIAISLILTGPGIFAFDLPL